MSFWSRIGNVFSGERVNRELDEEFASHLEEAIASGRDPEEVRRAFGSTLRQRERSREFRVAEWMESLLQDVRYGMRGLIRNPLFTLVAVSSLALGIGANAAIFAMAKTVLFDVLPVKEPQALRMLTWTSGPDKTAPLVWGDAQATPEGLIKSTAFSYPVYQALRKSTEAFEDLFAFKDMQVTVTAQGEPQLVKAEFLSGNTLQALGVSPLAGRLLTPSDDNGASAVAVISAAYWDTRFGRSPNAVGQTVTVNGVPVTIVGVTEPRFEGLLTGFATQVFVPLTMQPALSPRPQNGSASLLNNPQSWWLMVMARVRPDVGEARAQAQLDATFQHAMAGVTIQGGGVPHLHLQWQAGDRGLDYLKGAFAKPSAILLTLAAIVLLLACANLANLLLARATAREREMSTRVALGAGRMRIVRQMITESLLLSAMGGLAGLVLGYLGRNIIPQLLAIDDALQMKATFDWKVVLFTVGVAFATGLLFGAFPAWQATRASVSTALKDASQGTMNARKQNAGRMLVMVEIALSAILLIGAGLFVRTLSNLMHVSLGFRADHLMLFHLHPAKNKYKDAQMVALYRQIEDRLEVLPGVSSASVSNIALVGDGGSGSTFHVVGRPVPKEDRRIQMNLVGHNYFTTMGMPILRGRGFSRGDTATAPKVAVVNQALVKAYFPNQDPIGQTFESEDNPGAVQIVGIAADTSYNHLRAKTPALFFLPYEQSPELGQNMAVEVRTQGDPLLEAKQVRDVIASIDADLAAVNMRTMEEQIDSSLTVERIFAKLTTGFGLLALLLATIGIYGIMAYTVARRTNEIGLRMALGAKTTEVMTMILRDAGKLALGGLALGTIAALALAHTVETMLYGLRAFDPLTLAGTVVVLGGITLLAAFGPAYRASHVDPLRALRHE